MMWRLTAHENSVAVDRNPPPGKRQIATRISVQFHRGLASNHALERAVTNETVENMTRADVYCDDNSKNEERKNAPFVPRAHKTCDTPFNEGSNETNLTALYLLIYDDFSDVFVFPADGFPHPHCRPRDDAEQSLSYTNWRMQSAPLHSTDR